MVKYLVKFKLRLFSPCIALALNLAQYFCLAPLKLKSHGCEISIDLAFNLAHFPLFSTAKIDMSGIRFCENVCVLLLGFKVS